MSINIVRIDDRLIHGQVVTQWVQAASANKIVIVDDGTAADSFMTTVVKKLAPTGTVVDVYSKADAIEPLKELQDSSAARVLILIKGPEEILYMVENGIKIPEVIVGGMGIKPGRRSLYRNIAASDEEREVFKKLDGLGTKCYVQVMPKDKPQDVAKLV